MVSERDRVLSLIKYFESIGIIVNCGKNKARGNKGFFLAKKSLYRIDISAGLSDAEKVCVLLHEFAHFIHYSYDKTLKDLSFLFENLSDEILEELITLTVELIPKHVVRPLYNQKVLLLNEIEEILLKLNKMNISLKKTQVDKNIEKRINNKGLSLLLKYDKVKINNVLFSKVLDIDNLESLLTPEDYDLLLYLRLKSKYRLLKRVNSKIYRLNKYYNSNTELFARAFELFFLESAKVSQKAPKVFKAFEDLIFIKQNAQVKKCYEIIYNI